MSSPDDEYVSPDTISMPEASLEVVQESYQGPKASVEPVKATEMPQPSTGQVKLSESSPGNDQIQKGQG